METAISQMSVLPTTAEQIINFSRMLENELTSGTVNPFELLRIKKSIELVFDNIKPLLNELAQDEAAKYPEKTISYNGIKIDKSNTATYDYSVCGSVEYNKLIERKKELETFFKAVKEPMMMADESTGGEPIQINPPIKKTSEVLKISFAK